MSDNYGYPEDFQLRLLAAVVRKPKEMNGLVEPGYFSNPVHIEIAGLALGVQDSPQTKGAVLQKATLTAMVKGFLGKKKDLWSLYRKVIKQIYKLNLFDLPLLQNEALAFAKHMKFTAAIIGAEKDISNRKYDNVFRRLGALRRISLDEDLGLRYWDDYQNSSRWEEDRIGMVPTGYFKLLDRAMGGGVGVGELAIIEGGGKSGKSTMLGRIAGGAAWKGFNVALASGELSAFKYRKRIDSMFTGIPYADLPKRLGKTKRMMDSARKFCKGDIAIREFPSGRSKVEEIELWLTQLEDGGFKPDLLVVDYLALFKSNEHYDEKRLNMGQAAVDLRGLAMEKKIGCWTAAQVNRAGLDKPMLGPADLAEDVSQFFTLDFLIAICQTKADRKTPEERKEGKPEKGKIILVSARDVASGAVIDVTMQRNIFSITEVGYGKTEEEKTHGGR